MTKSKKIVELFAGSRSVSRVAESMGFEKFSADWQDFEGIDFIGDIENLSESDVPFIPDVVWASPDCTTYSIAAISTHRNGVEPKSDYAKKCDAVNKHFLGLINHWISRNPNLVFFIENPRGMLRKMPFMKDFNRHTVWYCQYGDSRAKPTDIWTNSKTWKPRPACRNYKYNSDGSIKNKHCHHEAARRGAKTGTQGKKGSYERSIIPEQLCREILESVFLAVPENLQPEFQTRLGLS